MAGTKAREVSREFARALQEHGIVKIYIGARSEDTKPFILPKMLLITASEYFQSALSEHFKEGQEGVLHFPNDDMGDWDLFIYWLFNKKFPGEEISLINSENLGREDAPSATRAWIFGDKYNLPVFQNAAMIRLLQSLGSDVLQYSLLQYIFENTVAGAVLREVAMEEILFHECKIDSIASVLTKDELESLFKIKGFGVEILAGCVNVMDRSKCPKGVTVCGTDFTKYMVT